MTEPKDGESFFRKVARFVANPTTDWAEINSRNDDPAGDHQKAELRAMVERKRRNDFVRKRELDMLRRIRREGLTPEQLAALGSSSSRMDEVERLSGNSKIDSKIDPGVKAKIDQIEQQMDGESFAPTQLQSARPAQGITPPGFFETSTRPGHFAATETMEPSAAPVSQYAKSVDMARQTAAARMAPSVAPPSGAMSSKLPDIHSLPSLDMVTDEFPTTQKPPFNSTSSAPSFEPVAKAVTKPPARAGSKPFTTTTSSLPKPSEPSVVEELPLPSLNMPLSFSVADSARVSATTEAHELAHDPELDEAAIAFANADYDSCERALAALIQPGGPHQSSHETWLVLFDHYRATGAQAKFEALVLNYAQSFGLSAPQWFSMPKLVADDIKNVRAPMGKAGGIGWTATDELAAADVAQLEKRCQNLPMPWVLDWTPLIRIDPEACNPLRQLFRRWAGQQVDMRWMGGDQFLQLLKDSCPVAQREIDPALWMLRLEALRLVNRPDQFDETAIDYCVTYEVSPPSWERAKCRVRISGRGLTTSAPQSTVPTETPSTTFMESVITDNAPLISNVQLELSGQLSGDISETLSQMTATLGAAGIVTVTCAKLIRLDFMAAGDLLNWVLSRKSENRTVIFIDAHRLVALFLGAMGVNEHARVKVRQV
jgi:hypothetical protein